MRTLYLDCFAGISGDMFVGALLDCGLGLEDLRHGLEKLGLGGYRIAAERVNRSGISATKFIVDIAQGHGDNHDDPSRAPPTLDNQGAHNFIGPGKGSAGTVARDLSTARRGGSEGSQCGDRSS